jgi:hypothetical protein
MIFKITKQNSFLFAYLNHSYNVYKPKKGDLNKVALDRLFRLCQTMLYYYSRVFIVRIDLHPVDFSADNKVMSIFLNKFISKLEKQYQCKVGYFCAREQNKSDKQHYHLALLLSGHKAMLPHNILTQLKTDWIQHCQGSVYFVDKPYYVIYRGDKASINPAIYRLSYLIKNHTKEHNKPANSYLCNEVKLRKSQKGDECNELLLVDPMITHRAKQQDLQYEMNKQEY